MLVRGIFSGTVGQYRFTHSVCEQDKVGEETGIVYCCSAVDGLPHLREEGGERERERERMR